MKKILLSVALFAGATGANAQIADGSAAPDFTATDLDGNSHTLSTYLAAGKAVVMDIYATWCGPCWNYHNGHALKDLYLSYGPDGSDELMVFSVEGDGATTVNDMYGTGGNTQGNWVEGTPYPMLNSATIANDYQITYYPTLYRMCADGLVYESGQLSAAQYKSTINSNCGTLTGVTDHAGIEAGDISMCDAGASDVVATIKNYGTNNLTSATAVLMDGATVVATQAYAGNSLGQWGTGTVTFTGVTLVGGTTYTVELTDVNGNTPHNTNQWFSADFDVIGAGQTDYSVTVNLHTDNYADEVYMEITNELGTVVWSEGNENVAGNYNTGTFPPAADPTSPLTNDQSYSWDVDLYSTNCYTFTIYDYYGDGVGVGGTGAGYDVLDNTGGTMFSESAANFGGSEAGLFKNNSVGIDELDAEKVSVYPNPTDDLVNVSFNAISAEYTVAIVDLQGRTIATQVFTGVSGAQKATFSTDGMASGSYIVKVTSDSGIFTDNIIVR